ncbi:co-regulatory protein PtrA N-terminal domain-containing protein [Pseudomonas sp. OTU5201]|uniref:co-regulatory protein PtrA N-terminal domain-containing protein n=1 Tax=Pseudomonas sp. OTU5201 TaxID=3043850 RepID=UPI00313F027A
MKSFKALFAVTVISFSGLAMVEGGADRTFARIEQPRQSSVEAYQVAQQQKGDAPAAGDQGKQLKHVNC